jgi:drug/metabolite transporter (DMT)-like permease
MSTTVVATAQQESATTKVRLALLTMVFFFGGSMPAYKWAAESFGPATANLGRFVLSASMLAFIARAHLRTVTRAQFRRLLVIGMFGIGLMAVFLAAGVDRGNATIGSIVVGLEPLGVALAGVLFAGDRPTSRSLLALAVGFAGAFVASGILTERTGEAPVVPMLLLFGTVVTFSIYTALVRRAAQGISPLAVAASTQIGALFFVVPACLFDIADGGMIRGDGPTGKAIGAVVFLGVGSAIGYLLLCSVLASQPSSRVAVTMFLTPMIGVVLSWLVIGERLHLRTAAGGALVLLAIYISEWAPSRRRADARG